MTVIGVDLAWGSTGGTGLCAVESGHVVDSTRVVSDAEIVAWIEPWMGACLVAVDAPLVVPNLTGRRPCETSISRAFGRYHASAHSSNRSMAAFASGTRAMALATAISADIDPHSTDGSCPARLLEVYPHPALVSLFDLPLTLKYKQKQNRPLSVRRAEFKRLVECLGALGEADPPLEVRSAPRWRALVRTVTESPVQAELDRVEDELDAFACAYIGLYHRHHGPPRSIVVGGLADGYIVVPVAGARRGSPLHPAAFAL